MSNIKKLKIDNSESSSNFNNKSANSAIDTSKTNSIIFSHLWIIENYDRFYEENAAWKWNLRSDIFSPPHNEMIKLFQRLYPKRFYKESEDSVGVGLAVDGLPIEWDGKIRCRCIISIVNESGDVLHGRQSEIYELVDGESKIFDDYIKRDQLMNASNRYLTGNKLMLRSEMTLFADDPIFKPIPTTTPPCTSLTNGAAHVTRLAHRFTIDNFSCLFDEEKGAPYWIESDEFSKSEGGRFGIRVWPYGDYKDNVLIGIKNYNEVNVTVHNKVWIEDENGDENYTRECTGLMVSYEGRYFPISRNYLLHPSNGLLSHNKLIICCELSAMCDGQERSNHDFDSSLASSDQLHQSSSFDAAQVQVHYVQYEWIIDRFSEQCREKSVFDSKIFSPPSDPRYAFHLRLHPHGIDEDSKDYVSLYLYNTTDDIEQVNAQGILSIIDENGQRYEWNYVCSKNSSKGDKHGYPKFIPLSQLLHPSLHLLPNDRLTILCELWVLEKRKKYLPKRSHPIQDISNNQSSTPASIQMINAKLQGASNSNSITFSHLWTIESYDSLYEENAGWMWDICSDIFSPPHNEMVEFSLKLYPKGYDKENEDYVSVGLMVNKLPIEWDGKIRCKWRISIVNESGDVLYDRGLKIFELFIDEAKGCGDYIKRDQLMNASNRYLTGNKLMLRSEMTLFADDPIFKPIPTTTPPCTSLTNGAAHVTRLAHRFTVENFSCLFDEEKGAPLLMESDEFSKSEGGQFFIEVWPYGRIGDDKDSVYIGIINFNEVNATVHDKVWIEDENGDENYTRESTELIESNNGRSFPISRQYLLDHHNGLLPSDKLTICCEIDVMCDGQERSNPDFDSASTSDQLHQSSSSFDAALVKVHYTEYKWTIDRFSEQCREKPCFFSKIFNPPSDPRYAFYLGLHTHGIDEDSKDYVSLYLHNITKGIKQVKADGRLSIMDGYGQRYNSNFVQCKSSTKGLQYGHRKFISLSHLHNPSLHLLPNDRLTVLCELWVLEKRKNYKPKQTVSQPSTDNTPSTSAISLSNSQNVVINYKSTSQARDINLQSTVNK